MAERKFKREEIDELTQQHESLSARIQSAQAQFQSIFDEQNRYEQRIQELKKEDERLVRKVEMLKTSIENLEKVKKEHDEESKLLRQVVEEKNEVMKEVDRLRSVKEEEVRMNESIHKQNMDLRRDLETKQSEVSLKKSEMKQIDEDLEYKKSSFERSFGESQKLLAEKTNLLQQKQDEQIKLESKVMDLMNNISAMEAKQRGLQIDLEDSESQKKQLHEQIADLVAEKQKNIDAIQVEYREFDKIKSELRSEKNMLARDRNILEQQKHDLDIYASRVKEYYKNVYPDREVKI